MLRPSEHPGRPPISRWRSCPTACTSSHMSGLSPSPRASASDYATLTRVPVLQVGACRIEHRSGICNM